MGRERQIVVYDPRGEKFRAGAHAAFEAGVMEDRSGRRRWLRSCCWLLAGLLVFLLVLVCLGVVIWLVVRPRSPDLTLQAVTLNDMKVRQAAGGSNVGGLTTVLYMNSTIQLSATNMNRVSVSYSAMLVNVSYKDLIVGNTSVPSFHQQAHSNVSVDAVLVVDNLAIVRANGQNLLRDAGNDHVPFQLTGQTNAHIHSVGFESRLRLQMTCEIVIAYQELKLASNTCKLNTVKV